MDRQHSEATAQETLSRQCSAAVWAVTWQWVLESSSCPPSRWCCQGYCIPHCCWAWNADRCCSRCCRWRRCCCCCYCGCLQAHAALAAVNGYQLDKNHVFKATPFDEFERLRWAGFSARGGLGWFSVPQAGECLEFEQRRVAFGRPSCTGLLPLMLARVEAAGEQRSAAECHAALLELFVVGHLTTAAATAAAATARNGILVLLCSRIPASAAECCFPCCSCGAARCLRSIRSLRRGNSRPLRTCRWGDCGGGRTPGVVLLILSWHVVEGCRGMPAATRAGAGSAVAGQGVPKPPWVSR